MELIQAPELQVHHWFNTESPLSLQQMRGKVVVLEAFQMLCPGCVSHGLPQMSRVVSTFAGDDVAVLGLHCVFEHHEAQGSREALAAFLHEYRLAFPVAIDLPSQQGGLPRTMAAYRMQGTPTTVLIDREGFIRNKHFGVQPDMVLGAQIMALVKAGSHLRRSSETAPTPAGDCDQEGCATG